MYKIKRAQQVIEHHLDLKVAETFKVLAQEFLETKLNEFHNQEHFVFDVVLLEVMVKYVDKFGREDVAFHFGQLSHYTNLS